MGSLAAAGAVVAEVRPGSRLGLLLGALAAAQALVLLAASWREWAATGADLPLVGAAMLVDLWAWPLPLLALPLVLLWFPDGDAPTGWRWVHAVPAVGLAGFVVSRFIPVDLADGQRLPPLPNPTGVPGAGALEAAVAAVPVAVVVGLLAAAAATGARWARADAAEREQLRWLVGAAGTAAALVAVGLVGDAAGTGEVGDAAVLLVPPVLGAGLVLATLRGVAADEASSAAGAERDRLQHDLHDSLGSALTGIRLGLASLARRAPEHRAELLALGSDVALAQAELRRLVDGLAPAALIGRHLAEAIDDLADPLRSAGIDVVVDAEGVPPETIAPEHEVALYKITAEALTNVARHAAARTCAVRVRVAADAVRLTVEDDGRGIDGSAHGVGLGSMAARGRDLGGEVTVRSGSGGGTTVVAVLPRAGAR